MVGLEDLEKRPVVLLLGLFAAAQLLILWKLWNSPVVWDTAIYFAMGKHLYTGGAIGLWEVFRPPLLPAVLGALWKAGMPAIGYTRLLSIVISTAGAAAVYRMVEDLYTRRKALISTAFLLATGLYMHYSHVLLTGLPASILVFTSLYLVEKKRVLPAGVAGGLAFLMRFPSAMVGPAAVAYLLYRERDMEGVRKAVLYTAGFFLVALPFLAAMKFYYGSFLQPFIAGVAVPASTANKYLAGLYYIFHLGKSNPLMLLAPVGVYTALKQKKMEVFASGLAMFYLFFTVFPHKEVRFALLFLPLAALFAAEGAERVAEKLDGLNVTRIAVAASIVLLLFFAGVYMDQGVNRDAVSYYRAHSNLSGTVASNDASIMAYGDVKYFALPPSTLEGSFENAKDQADYFSINSCAWYCTPTVDNCEQRIDAVEKEIRASYAKVFELNGSYCNYGIYRVG